MQRRHFLETAGSTALATMTPAFLGFDLSFGSSDAFSGLALSDEADLDTFREGHPGFVLKYENADQRKKLETWVNNTETGEIHRDLSGVNMLAVNMSWADAGRSQILGIDRFEGGFAELGYLEYADGDAFLQRTTPFDPEELASGSGVGFDLGWVQSQVFQARGLEYDTGGLAFDGDAPTATLREARNLTRATDSLIDDVDTSNARVCVIDTGIGNYSIYDGRVHADSTNFTPGGGDPTVGEDGISAVADGDGHGSWVAACILANHSQGHYTGFAPDAELVVAKSLEGGNGSVADIVAGIELAIETNSDVACLSLGSPQWSDPIADALADAWEAGVVPVVAVGNDRYASTFVAAPASSEHGFGVNATNVPESGDRDETKLAYFGNIGPAPGTQDLSGGASEGATPQLAAPGMNVEVDPVGTLSGTSMAAPMVAGGATLLAAEGHDNETILERLTTCAYPVPNFGTTEAEHGLLDVEAALYDIEPDETQADVRNDAATARDAFNEALSESRGRTLAGLFG